MKVYLCGPINGCTDEEANDWRESVIAHFPDAINPMVRDYRGREEECFVEIVELDKRDIAECDVLLVNYSKPSVGTAMEVYIAWKQGKPIVVWHPEGASISPWLRYHASDFVHSFNGAIKTLREIATCVS